MTISIEEREGFEKYNIAQQEAAIESKREEIERQKAEEAKRLQKRVRSRGRRMRSGTSRPSTPGTRSTPKGFWLWQWGWCSE